MRPLTEGGRENDAPGRVGRRCGGAKHIPHAAHKQSAASLGGNKRPSRRGERHVEPLAATHVRQSAVVGVSAPKHNTRALDDHTPACISPRPPTALHGRIGECHVACVHNSKMAAEQRR